MLRFTHHFDKPLPIEKIEGLCKLLRKETQAYQILSASVRDMKTKNTILALANETNQNANELYAQVFTGGDISEKESEINTEEFPAETPAYNNEEALSIFCSNTEQRLVSAYREVLNESFFDNDLRKKISYQLNGTLCSLMRIKHLDIPDSKK